MHTFTAAKKSYIIDDTELTDQELVFALNVRNLLQRRMSKIFWSYVRLVGITFTLTAPDDVALVIRLELLIPQVEDVAMEWSTVLIDDPLMVEVVVATALSYIEDLLRMHARETQASKDELYEAARRVRK